MASALVHLSIECPFDRTGPLHIFLQCTKSICVDILIALESTAGLLRRVASSQARSGKYYSTLSRNVAERNVARGEVMYGNQQKQI